MISQSTQPGGELLLYTTAGCHLCEQAKTVLWPVVSQFQLSLREVDIAENDEMIARYGLRIPVVARTDGGEELDWPFTTEQVARLMHATD